MEEAGEEKEEPKVLVVEGSLKETWFSLLAGELSLMVLKRFSFFKTIYLQLSKEVKEYFYALVCCPTN